MTSRNKMPRRFIYLFTQNAISVVYYACQFMFYYVLHCHLLRIIIEMYSILHIQIFPWLNCTKNMKAYAQHSRQHWSHNPKWEVMEPHMHYVNCGAPGSKEKEKSRLCDDRITDVHLHVAESLCSSRGPRAARRHV